jgi:hypothetical protein
MVINFLNFSEARLEFRNSPYLNQFNREELRIRLGLIRSNPFAQEAVRSDSVTRMRKVLYNIYLESCRDFTPEEQEAISFCCQRIDQIIREKTGGSFFLPNNFQINFLKLDSLGQQLDWGYLYTINETIVLPNNYLDDLTESFRLFLLNTRQIDQNSSGPRHVRPDYQLLRSHLVNLYHETIHLLQRTPKMSGIYQKIFKHIYQRIWGFLPVSKEMIRGLGNDDNFITNPDGFNFEWIVPLYNFQTKQHHYFLPALVFDHQTRVPSGVLIEMRRLRDGTYQSANRWDRLERFPNYVKKFYGLRNQLYHPNEVLAQLLSEYLVGDQTFNSHTDSFYFYSYIDKYLLRSNNL